MQGNSEAKKKCLEKLSEMEKYLPFLDFMIDKIKKKGNEISLECQLSKFQNLRSMIRDKSCKYSLDAIVRVEEVIQKLIVKLDYKDGSSPPPKESIGCKVKPNPVGSSLLEKGSGLMEKARNPDSSIRFISSSSTSPSSTTITTAISSSTTTTNYVTNASCPNIISVDENTTQHSPMNTVAFVMKSNKMSVDGRAKNDKTDDEKGKGTLENSVGPEDAGKDTVFSRLELDLDKDLDGFDLTDVPLVSGGDFKNSANESATEVPKTNFFNQDLLSTSRVKLMMSLEKILGPSFIDGTLMHSAKKNNNGSSNLHKISSTQSISALNSSDKLLKTCDKINDNFQCCGKGNINSKLDKIESGEPVEKSILVPLSPSSPEDFQKMNSYHHGESCNKLSGVQPKPKPKVKVSLDEYKVHDKTLENSLKPLKSLTKCKKSGHKNRREGEEEADELFKPDLMLGIQYGASSISSNDVRTTSDNTNLGRVKQKSNKKRSKSLETKQVKESKTDKSQVLNEKVGKTAIEMHNGATKRQQQQSNRGGEITERSNYLCQENKLDHSCKDKSSKINFLNETEVSKENVQSISPTPMSMDSKVRISMLKNIFNEKIEPRSLKKNTEISSGNELRKLTKLVGSSSVAVPSQEAGGREKKRFTQRSTGVLALHVKDRVENNSLDDSDYVHKLIDETTICPAQQEKNQLLHKHPSSDFESSGIPTNSSNGGTLSNRDPRLRGSAPVNPVSNSIGGSAMVTNCPGQSFSSTIISKPPVGNSVIKDVVSNPRSDSLSAKSCQSVKNDVVSLGAIYISSSGDMLMSQNKSDSVLQSKVSCSNGLRLVSNNDPDQQEHMKMSNRVAGPSPNANRSSEAKSYAEYKRLKKMEEDKLKEKMKRIIDPLQLTQGNSTAELTAPNKSLVIPQKMKFNYGKSNGKPGVGKKTTNFNQNLSTGYKNHSPVLIPVLPFNENTRKGSGKNFRDTNLLGSKLVSRMNHMMTEKKNGCLEKCNDGKNTPTGRRLSLDLEDIISPLEHLYGSEDASKTGRGYGLHNFRIPKKGHQTCNTETIKTKEDSGNLENVTVTQIPDEEARDKDLLLRLSGEKGITSASAANVHIIGNKTNRSENVDPQINLPANQVRNDDDPASATNTSHTNNYVTMDAVVHCDDVAKKSAEISDDTEIERNGVGLACAPLKDCNLPKRLEKQLAKTGISVGGGSTCNSSATDFKTEKIGLTRKKSASAKGEITQELVETLIRKSFESGEGKLLFAQAKLFEKLALKLNSKKLKTIQKIINSESDCSISSSFENTSEEDDKKQKDKYEKCKPKKKKYRKIKKLDSSSSERGGDTDDEKGVIRNEVSDSKVVESPEASKVKTSVEERTASDVSAANEPEKKIVKKRGAGRKRKKRRNKEKKKLLEQILSEEPQLEGDSKSENYKDKTTQEERKPKRRSKNELDKLHDDIRDMFICSGVITATGQRMCRMLKEVGGKMDTIYIIKESAKMVQEEKLKLLGDAAKQDHQNTKCIEKKAKGKMSGAGVEPSKGHVRNGKESNSAFGNPVVKSENFKKQPCVLLFKLDLDTFDYGVNISERDAELCRIKGKNNLINKSVNCQSAKKIASTSISIPKRSKLKQNVFLERNVKKCRRQCPRKMMKPYKGKTLNEILKALPLKASYVNYVKFTDSSIKDDQTKTILNCTTEHPNGIHNLADCEHESKEKSLIDHIFEKNKTRYCCMLCSLNTKFIAYHYRTMHPESEILISRLSKNRAKKAIQDSLANNYCATNSEQWCRLDTMQNNVKPWAKNYCCIFCGCNKYRDFDKFSIHIANHTGEFRFRCPQEGCTFSMTTEEGVKYHILTAHNPKSRDIFDDIKSWVTIPDEYGNLLGHICSVCNYVQITLNNLKIHVKKHSTLECASVFKINMSDNAKNDKSYEASLDECPVTGDSFVGIIENISGPDSSNSDKDKTEKKTRLHKREHQEGSSEAKGVAKVEQFPQAKKARRETEDLIQPPVNEFGGLKDLFVNDDETVDVGDVPESILLDTCFDVGIFSDNKSNKTSESLQVPGTKATIRVVRKLKVGPLEAQIFENSVVLYECYVKGCLFSTELFDVFEKHVKISHTNTKWNGTCDLCRKHGSQVHLTSTKLIYALNHLRHHEGGRQSQNKFRPKVEVIPDVEDEIDEQKVDNFETDVIPYPRKPLLRVRSLVGDRLSTPKETRDSLISGGDCLSQLGKYEPKTNDDGNCLNESAAAMFTIENVRSLKCTDETDETDLQVEDLIPCVEENYKSINKHNELVEKAAVAKAVVGKPVVVRSCPTPKIAIRPDFSPVPVEVNHLKVVKTATVNPVVLNSLTKVAPIRISTVKNSPPISKFTVQPIKVSITPPFLPSASAVSVFASVTSAMTTTANLPTPATSLEFPSPSQKSTPEEGNPSITMDNTTVGAKSLAKGPKSPTKRGRTKVYRPDGFASSSEVEDSDDPKQRLMNNAQKAFASGSKVIKDPKVYEEMLTKKKLCHLFKCMAAECSFTCNKESIFTQHIGLHEAQVRRENPKAWKHREVDSRSGKSFNWYQCSYCCEVHANAGFALSRHIMTEHGHCIYQCAFCFYRAVSQTYVEIHQNLSHGTFLKSNPRIIYKCQPLSPAPTVAASLEKQGRRQSVRPYHCDQCGSKFFITQEFMDHMTTEHQGVTAYACHICKNFCFKADRLIIHYKLHSYCTYQCAYCLHGTETEKEMVFHLCNFHFSQPPYMYVRAWAENQKSSGSQLDSLKVITFDGENGNSECVVEADWDEEQPADESAKNFESSDISAIVAELGISIEAAPLGDSVVEASLTENGSATEEKAVLISSGSQVGREGAEERDVSSVPLGQLSVQLLRNGDNAKVAATATSKNPQCLDKDAKLNEIMVNLHPKEITLSSVDPSEGESVGSKENCIATAFHKLPPVVLSRKTGPKNVYPPKNTTKTLNKKDDSSQENSNDKTAEEPHLGILPVGAFPTIAQRGVVEAGFCQAEGVQKPREKTAMEEKGEHALMATVLTFSSGKSAATESDPSPHSFPKILQVCSLSSKTEPRDTRKNSCNSVIKGGESTGNNYDTLKPPIIRLEDFRIDDCVSSSSVLKVTEVKTEKAMPESQRKSPPDSPEVIILEEDKTDKVLTVTIDSDDEKESQGEGNYRNDDGMTNRPGQPADDRTIRKEMEKLRNQIASETDCLLFDDTEKPEMPVKLTRSKAVEKTKELLSPIEEAISTLNKKLEEEVDGKKKKNHKSDEEMRSLPRTRSFTKEKARKGEEGTEKSDSDDPGSKTVCSLSEISRKDHRKFKEGLSGKDLYMCGNEKCNFSANGDLELKDHLYVCDLSRETATLMCPHCSKPVRLFNTYLEHLKHHGEKKYGCGLCSFTSAVETSVTRHVKQKHKCDQLRCLPKEPHKDGYFVYYPKSYKLDKQDFESSGYSPGDENKLPLQAVYQVNVKCAKCPYFTKVRSNMVRHLKIHVKSAETEGGVVVPSTAPTNPVPCLDTKERMFDKMTNLAASSQLAQAKERSAIETLAPEDEAKLPQLVAEQMRYKCCLPDCNYITVDDGMLKHHIKALHDEISHYNCPHCTDSVDTEVRQVALEKLGYHLKLHDAKLYKCPHCQYFHYQKAVVEKHTLEKHPDRRYYVHTVREPQLEPVAPEEPPGSESPTKGWKCGLCDDCHSLSRLAVLDHLAKVHGTKSKYKCRLCDMKSNHNHSFFGHFGSKHAGEKVGYVRTMVQVNSSSSDFSPSKADTSGERFDTTPLWQRGAPRVRHIRGILIEEEEIKAKKSKKPAENAEARPEATESATPVDSFYCPLCSDKKVFHTRSADIFRSHLYQELNYQQFACILCGKMFVDKKDYERHHSKSHGDKPQSMKQTKEDGEIMFWVDKVIAKQKEEIEEKKKRELSDEEAKEGRVTSKKKKKSD